MGYGTGAIMAVPAHDERDFEFAQKFNLPIKEVLAAQPRSGEGGEVPCGMPPLIHFAGDGFAVNSPLIEGLPTAAAQARMIEWLEENGHGQRDVRYKLRDWLFSRQRYWGEPFPIIWRDGKHEALPESELPLTPPELEDFKPTGTGEPPLARAKEWLRYSDAALRETNTMPQWAGSCWYYLRFCDPRDDDRFVGRAAEKYWMGGEQPGGVDLYVGGTEHAVLHLLVCALLAEGALRPRAPFKARAVSAPGQSRNDPRRGRPQDVEALGQRDRPARRNRGVRRGRVPLLRDVHGPARANETLEHERRGGRLAFSRARLAFDHGRESGRRVDLVERGGRRSHRRKRC